MSRRRRSLLVCEARHHGIYLDLAAKIDATGALDVRLAQLAEHEAEIIGRPCDRVRLHAG